MAIELPPPLPPQPLPAAQLRQIAGTQTVDFQHYRIHLPADGVLQAHMVEEAIAGADTIDEAMSALSQAWYAKGHLSTQLLYAVDADDIYVGLFRRKISALEAPESLRPYFAPLVGAAASDRAFETQRALANVKADRAGIAAQARLEPTADGATLQIEPDGRELPTTTVKADFGNPGNRFVGRHFFDLDLRHSNQAGDQFKLLWNTALTGISDGRADDYNEESLSWDRVTTAGVWGIGGRAIDYNGGGDRDGTVREARLTWLMPLAATLHSRLLLDARVDYLNRELSTTDTQLREEYPSVQLAVHYSRSASPDAGPLDLDIGSTFRKGLRSDVASTGADLDYFLWRPTVSVNLALSDDWNTGLLLAGQLSTNTLPLENQWVLGGIDNLAAYLPGIVVGDTGAYGALDLLYRGWNLGEVHVSPRVFVEYGLSRYERQSDAATNGTSMLADVGGELHASWRFLETSLALATPIAHHRVSSTLRDDSEANLLFRVTARF